MFHLKNDALNLKFFLIEFKGDQYNLVFLWMNIYYDVLVKMHVECINKAHEYS